MLLRHLRYLLAVAEHRTSPAPPRRCTFAADPVAAGAATGRATARAIARPLRQERASHRCRRAVPASCAACLARAGSGATSDPRGARPQSRPPAPGHDADLHLLSGGRPGGSVQSALSGHRVEPRGVAPGRPGGGADRRSPGPWRGLQRAGFGGDRQPAALPGASGPGAGAEHPAADAPLAAAALAELPLALLRDDFATRRHIDAYLRQQGDGAGGAGGELDQRHRRRGSPRKTGQHPAGGGGAPAGRVALRGAAAGVADPPGSAVLAPGQPPGAARLAFQALALELGAELGDA